MSVLVVLQSRGGEWHQVSLEAATAGQQLASSLSLPLHLAVLGGDAGEAAERAASFPVNNVYAMEHPLVTDYRPETYSLALQQLISTCKPRFVVFAHTYQSRDYAPKLAARFGTSLIGDVIKIRVEAGAVFFVRQLFLGKMHAEVSSHCNITFVSIQASAFRAMEPSRAGASATMERVNIDMDSADLVSRPEPPFRTVQSTVNLKAAKTIVSAGRGIKQQEDLSLVEALAKALGGELAASRPVCDSGWVSMDRLVGSSGQTVAPNLYVAVGISGAIQHLLGMKGARTVVAINNDRSAPIFDHAHYGIVGDLRAVLPALLEELRKAQP